MTEQIPENDFSENAKDMTPEANADISRGHLVRWALEHHQLHYVDGEIVIQEGQPAPEDSSEEVVTDMQNPVPLRKNDASHKRFRLWPRAS